MDSLQLVNRTKLFAHRCVKLALSLPNSILGNHIKKQLIRCSSSVASNYRAACLAQSKPSFIAKLSIVIEEADESNFWLVFIKDENLLYSVSDELNLLISESNELTAIFIASRKTAQTKSTNQSVIQSIINSH